jgi:hypothetical protein
MIVSRKRSSEGRLPHGTVEGYIKDLNDKGIPVTRDMLKGRVKAIMKENGPPLTVEAGGISVVSGVTPTTPSPLQVLILAIIYKQCKAARSSQGDNKSG